jgi:RimJ/RimL family protein N-acetyltransferase
VTTELLTERLLLREFRESDWRAVHEMLVDPEVTQYTPAGTSSKEESREATRRLVNDRSNEPPRHSFAITLRPLSARSGSADSEATVIGTCFLALPPDKPRQGDLGYLLARPYWGRGYATEAARAVLRYGFQELHLHRIYATSRPANVASWRVMEKLGMRREAHLVQHRYMKGRWVDSLLYAILDHEWQAYAL